MTTKNQKLLTQIGIVFCPECEMSCIPVSCYKGRIVIRHQDQGKLATECKNKGKMWSIPTPSLSATEI